MIEPSVLKTGAKTYSKLQEDEFHYTFKVSYSSDVCSDLFHRLKSKPRKLNEGGGDFNYANNNGARSRAGSMINDPNNKNSKMFRQAQLRKSTSYLQRLVRISLKNWVYEESRNTLG